MITGTWTEDDEAIISISLIGSGGKAIRIDAIIDTGFKGSLLLPPSLVLRLNMPQIDFETVRLADGSFRRLPVYEAHLIWNESEVTVNALVADNNALIGTEILRGCVGTFEFVPGGSIILEPLDD